MLSDFNKDWGRDYGVLFDHASGLRGVLRRAVFVIDGDGRLTYRWDVGDPPSLPKSDDVLAEVRKLDGNA